MMSAEKELSENGSPSSVQKRGRVSRSSPVAGHLFSIIASHLAALRVVSWYGSTIGSVPCAVPNTSHFAPFGARRALSRPAVRPSSCARVGSTTVRPAMRQVSDLRVNQSWLPVSPGSFVDSPLRDPTLRLITIHAVTMKAVQLAMTHTMPLIMVAPMSSMFTTFSMMTVVTGSTRRVRSASMPCFEIHLLMRPRSASRTAPEGGSSSP
eukprot:585287-Prymnesium_polylepis.2